MFPDISENWSTYFNSLIDVSFFQVISVSLNIYIYIKILDPNFGAQDLFKFWDTDLGPYLQTLNSKLQIIRLQNYRICLVVLLLIILSCIQKRKYYYLGIENAESICKRRSAPLYFNIPRLSKHFIHRAVPNP